MSMPMYIRNGASLCSWRRPPGIGSSQRLRDQVPNIARGSSHSHQQPAAAPDIPGKMKRPGGWGRWCLEQLFFRSSTSPSATGAPSPVARSLRFGDQAVASCPCIADRQTPTLGGMACAPAPNPCPTPHFGLTGLLLCLAGSNKCRPKTNSPRYARRFLVFPAG